jgi:hypothetical protein
MRAAASVSEPWLTINAAVQLYNAALPCMQQQRYADLYRWLRPTAEALVALKPADSDGPLVVAMAEALGRAAEHRLLLAASKAKAARAEGEAARESQGGGAREVGRRHWGAQLERRVRKEEREVGGHDTRTMDADAG